MVFYVSHLRTNLLSVSKITDRGVKVIFREKDAIVLYQSRDVLLRADRVGNLYYVRKSRNTERNAEIKMAVKKSIDECHEKLGHLNERDLSPDERTENLLKIVHTDLCGPMRHSWFLERNIL